MSTTTNNRRILVATNGSHSSQAAVERGLELALKEEAEVVFLHVAPPQAWRTSRLGPAPAIATRLPAPRQDEALRSAAARASELGVPARLELISGDAARVIRSVAAELDVDLVVVGASGRNPFHEHVGSKVLHGSKRTVFVARRQELAEQPARRLQKAA